VDGRARVCGDFLHDCVDSIIVKRRFAPIVDLSWKSIATTASNKQHTLRSLTIDSTVTIKYECNVDQELQHTQRATYTSHALGGLAGRRPDVMARHMESDVISEIRLR